MSEAKAVLFDWQKGMQSINGAHGYKVFPAIEMGVILTASLWADTNTGGKIFPGTRLLAKRAGTSDEVVTRTLWKAREMNVLERVKAGVLGTQQSDEYRLVKASDWQVPDRLNRLSYSPKKRVILESRDHFTESDPGKQGSLKPGISQKVIPDIGDHSESDPEKLGKVIPEIGGQVIPDIGDTTTHVTTHVTTHEFVRPSVLQVPFIPDFEGDEEAPDTATPPGPLPEEPLSHEGLAPAEEVAEMCNLHVSYPADECPYCGRPERTSNAPQWKQRQWYENSQQQNEASGLDGYPVEDAEIARLSDVKKRRRLG